MSHPLISIDDYRRAVSLRDLTDPAQGAHAIQVLIGAITEALAARWGCALSMHRANPVISIEDNYDRLNYPPEGAARDARYTRYVSERLLLRTMTTAMVPCALRRLADLAATDVLVACPGLVYRRDAIDRLHTGEPHQLDLWRIRTGAKLSVEDLGEMVSLVVELALPGQNHRTIPVEHPYTENGLEIYVRAANEWVEIGECGLALPSLLQDNHLDPRRTSGLAMGLGLDRILMLRKGIDHVAKGFFLSRRRSSATGDTERNEMIAMRERLEAVGVEFVEYSGPTEILPDVWVTGPVERRHPERNYPRTIQVNLDGEWVEDYVPESQALTIVTDRGPIVVLGCGHSGTVNVVEQVQASIQDRPIHALMGGMHLYAADDQTLGWTADRLRDIGVQHLMAGHCTGVEPLLRLRTGLNLSRRTAVVGAVGSRFVYGEGIHPTDIAQ